METTYEMNVLDTKEMTLEETMDWIVIKRNAQTYQGIRDLVRIYESICGTFEIVIDYNLVPQERFIHFDGGYVTMPFKREVVTDKELAEYNELYRLIIGSISADGENKIIVQHVTLEEIKTEKEYSKVNLNFTRLHQSQERASVDIMVPSDVSAKGKKEAKWWAEVYFENHMDADDLDWEVDEEDYNIDDPELDDYYVTENLSADDCDDCKNYDEIMESEEE